MNDGPGCGGYLKGLSVADFDGDGWCDVFTWEFTTGSIGMDSQSKIWINAKREDPSSPGDWLFLWQNYAEVALYGRWNHAAFADVNGDGLMDVFMSRQGGQGSGASNMLFKGSICPNHNGRVIASTPHSSLCVLCPASATQIGESCQECDQNVLADSSGQCTLQLPSGLHSAVWQGLVYRLPKRHRLLFCRRHLPYVPEG